MEDLSLHLLDIAENSLNAGATLVEMKIHDDPDKNLLRITIRDNGKGMDPKMVKEACDPFVTTRTTRRVGLGLSLFKQAAQEAGGNLSVTSEPGRGTEIQALFRKNHIDLKPMGDMGATLTSLIAGYPDADFIFESNLEGKNITLDTREIRAVVNDTISMNSPSIIKLIRELFEGN